MGPVTTGPFGVHMTRRNCHRDECDRAARAGYTHCSQVCRLLEYEFTTLEQVCRLDDSGLSAEVWASLAEIADAWSKYVKHRGRLNRSVEAALEKQNKP